MNTMSFAPDPAPACLSSDSLEAAVRRVLRRRRSILRTSAGAVTVAIVAGLAPAAHGWPAEVALSRLLPGFVGDGSEGFVVEGVADQYLPFPAGDGHISRAGDLNADGIADLIFGGYSAGMFVVLYGRDTGQVGLFEPVIDLLEMRNGDGSQGFELDCDNDPTDECLFAGSHVRNIGDLNGDGIGDIVLSIASDSESTKRGYVVFGNAAGFPPQFELSDLSPRNGGDGTAGFALAGVGVIEIAAANVNGAGPSDLLLGVASADAGGRPGAGQGYLLFGRPRFPAQVDLTLLLPDNGGDGSKGFVLNGVAADDNAATAVASGDINGDGLPDMVLGAESADPGGRSEAGQVFVVFGRDAGGGATFPPAFELASLLAANRGDGSEGFVLHGDAAGDDTGAFVAVGDMNGDGIGDVIAAATHALPPVDPFYGRPAGRIYVLFGRSLVQGGFPPEIELADLLAANGGDGTDGFVVNGHPDSLTDSISAGPMNGDGIDDLIVGAAEGDTYPSGHPGRAYVVFGRDAAQGGFPAEFESASLLAANGGDGSEGLVLKGAKSADFTGGAVKAAGDVNGDGFDDILVEASGENQVCHPWPNCLYYRGRSYVVFGGAGNLRPDTDVDGVPNDVDACPNTSLPERVPLVRLGNDRFALLDESTTFWIGPGTLLSTTTLGNTRGCSCGQIITRLGHGRNERRFGCTQATMTEWINGVDADALVSLGLPPRTSADP